MVKWVRTKGPRRRGSLHTLVRSVPRIGQRIPPVPWIGTISRYLYPTEVSDYESLATGSWTVGNFKPQWTWPANTFSGNPWECYYHLMAVPEESTSEVEVILPPIRYAVEEATVSGGDFDHWYNNPIGQPNAEQYESGTARGLPGAPTPKRGLSPLCSNTLLPVSGDSHVSDGKPTSLEFHAATSGLFHHAYYSVGGWNPTTLITPFPQAQNHEVTPAYIRIRINGTAVGSLIDFRTWADWYSGYADDVQRTIGALFRITRFPIIFPTMPASSLGEPRESWELDFVAGDELEVDVWWRIRARPRYDTNGRYRGGFGAKTVLAVIARHDTVTGARIYDGPSSPVSGHMGGGLPQAVLTGLKISDGFDPDADTYTFEAVGGTGNFGDGSAGAHKAEAGDGWAAPVITSRQLTWGYNSSGGSPPVGPPGNADWLGDAGGSGAWTLINNFCSVGFIPEEPPFPSTALQTNNRDCVADVPATPWPDATQIGITLDWQLEICVLKIQITRTGLGTVVWYFRPQNSSDYITEVTDRSQGDLTCGPCGVFNHLGTTTFIPWYGTQEDPYTPPSDSDRPTSIIVTKVAQ